MSNGEDLIGHKINKYEVMGRERDGSNNWVGADLLVRVQPFGRFMLRVVTKQEFASERVKNWQDDLEEMSPDDFADDNSVETKLPFVLNDEQISDEVLESKFSGRIIKDDLAASMWPIGEEDAE